MTTFLFSVLLGVFWAALAYQLLKWMLSTLRIGAFQFGSRHVSRRINPSHYWITVVWSGVVATASIAGAVMVLAALIDITFGTDLRFWL